MKARHLGKWLTVAWVVLAASSLPVRWARAAPGEASVSIVSDPEPGPGAAHGLAKLTSALEARAVVVKRAASITSASDGQVVLVGLASAGGPVAEALKAAGASVPAAAEALTIRHTTLNGKPGMVVAGSDDRGLMYALLDVADRVGWAADPARPFTEVKNAAEKPYVPERALSVYTMHRKHFESRFYDEAYWARYLDMLAANRFNTFVLIFGYENWGYFSPPYPYFFDLDGFPDVRVVGITREKQRKNLRALNRLVEMAHARGLDFTLGIWDHIYRGGVQGPTDRARKPTPGIVWGLTADNLRAYSTAALAEFLRLVPDLDTIHFRMHGESGLKRGEMPAFWEDIYRIVNASRPGIRFDARAKNFPHDLIDKAVEMGVNIRMCTKYWMEQMGLPFHPTHIHPANQHDRRHGYADMLRYPQTYKMHWRLWNGGTTRILLWGDPDYVRRFAGSTHLYDGEGFEVNEPLATKMQDHPHDAEPFELLRPEHRYYEYEFERYWHFFQTFGRAGYNPDTPPEVWRKAFERRFGPQAGPYVMRAVHRASQVLPRAVAYSYPYNHFPTTRGWVERQRQEDLPAYAKALPSDTEQFLSIADAARCIVEGKDSGKIWPHQSSAWFARAAADVLGLVAEAEKRIGDHRNKEFDSTMVDLKILAHLARYHSRRALAGVAWALFAHITDVSALEDAIAHEREATRAWEGIVEAAGDMYHDDLAFGRRRSGLAGHWRDELVLLNNGLADLEQKRKDFRPKAAGASPLIAHVPIRRTPPGKDLTVRATVSGQEPLTRVRVGYRSARGDVAYADMGRTTPFVYCAAIPESAVTEGLTYFLEATDEAGRRATWPPDGQTRPIAVTVTRDTEPPAVAHEPIARAPAGKPLTVTATVRDPSGVKWVRLRYRGVNQTFDYQTLPMLPTGEKDQYQAEVPAEHVDTQWDFMYFIEVMDTCGNGKIHPDLETETPYVVVRLQR